MIVICTKCQAKFRVADDRVGPRGAKVRCSRCQTVFVVRRDAPPPPAADPAGAPPATPSDDPFAPPRAAAPDPFGGADPFAAAATPPPTSSSPLVTDLSDLLGPAAGSQPRAAPPPLPAGAAAEGAGSLAAEAPALAVEPTPPPAPALEPPPPPPPDPTPAVLAPSAPADDGGLALEDRLTPPPVKVPGADWSSADAPVLDAGFDILPGNEVPPAEPPAAAGDPFAGGGTDPFDPGSFEYDPDPGEAPGVPQETAPPAPEAPAAPPVDERPPAEQAPPAAPSAPAPAPARRIPGLLGSRVRAVAVNAIALVALLAVALAILVVWRSGGALTPAALRPSAVLAALRGRPGPGVPYTAEEVRGGLYDRRRGAPLLFVRGKVVSHAPAPVRSLVVKVEVVRAGAVLARGEAVAGAVPSVEELWEAADAAALSKAASAARLRAPGEVRPGDELPFLVAIGDAPPELEGAALHVEVAPAGSERR